MQQSRTITFKKMAGYAATAARFLPSIGRAIGAYTRGRKVRYRRYRRPFKQTRTTRQYISRPMRGYYRRAGFYGRFGPGKEAKFADVQTNFAPITTSGTIANIIPNIAQGTTESTRIGRRITITQINGVMHLTKLTTTTVSATSDVIRCMIILDKQTNGAAPATTDVLETASFYSFNNLANKGRFRTLYDKRIALNCQAAAWNGATEDYSEQSKLFKYFKRCSIPIEYDGTTGAITERKSNNIYVLIISALANSAEAIWHWRVRFTDA